MSGFVSLELLDPVRLATATALNVNKGVVGAAAAGLVGDSLLYKVYIPANAGPLTLTVAGFADSAGAAQSWVFTGSTTNDTSFSFDDPLRNWFGPMILTASAANLIWVGTRAYVGA